MSVCVCGVGCDSKKTDEKSETWSTSASNVVIGDLIEQLHAWEDIAPCCYLIVLTKLIILVSKRIELLGIMLMVYCQLFFLQSNA